MKNFREELKLLLFKQWSEDIKDTFSQLRKIKIIQYDNDEEGEYSTSSKSYEYFPEWFIKMNKRNSQNEFNKLEEKEQNKFSEKSNEFLQVIVEIFKEEILRIKNNLIGGSKERMDVWNGRLEGLLYLAKVFGVSEEMDKFIKENRNV